MHEMHEAVEQLCGGFSETLEYRLRGETRTHVRQFPGLLSQLTAQSTVPMQSRAQGPSGPNKSGSRPPTNNVYSDMVDTIHESADMAWVMLERNEQPPAELEPLLTELSHSVDRMCVVSPREAMTVVCMAQSWVRSARILLGYESRQIVLANTSCHVCGGELVVAADASTDVRCMTNGCGTAYERLRWIDLL